MTVNNDWFPKQEKSRDIKPSAGDIILDYIRSTSMTYPTEIADDLTIDPRTVQKWLKHLLASNHIERVDMAMPPSPQQRNRIDELKSGGMQQNHFNNAKWYMATESQEGKHGR